MAGNWIREQVKKWLQKTGIEIDIEPSITLFGIITLSAGKMEVDPDEWTEKEKEKISDTLRKTVGISMEDFQALLGKEINKMGMEKIRSDFNKFMESRQKFDQVVQLLRRNPFMTIEEFLNREENRIHCHHFVGREREWEDFHRFLDTSPQKIELMIGEGGKGKTRMAINFAKRAQKLGWEVFFFHLFGNFYPLSLTKKTLFILDEPLRCRDRDSLIDFVINIIAEQSVKLLILSRPMFRSQIENELEEKGADPIIHEVDVGDIATFLARNYEWINEGNAKNLEKKCGGNFVIAILQAEYFKREKRGGLPHYILGNRVEKYIKDLAMRTGKNISDIREILFILSLITPLHAKTDVVYLESVLFAPENAALQEVLRMACSGDSDLLFLSGEQYIFKYDLIANYLGQQFVKREREIQRWIQKLLPYAPSRISINLFQILEYDRRLLTKIFSLLSTIWSYLNTIGGKTSEYFVAIQIFTFYLKDYSFFQKENMDIRRWVECYKEISRSCPEEEIEVDLAQGLVNASYMYANTADFSRMEECLNELRSLYREHPEKEVREKLAGGLRNATKGYVETANSSKVKKCLNELRSLYREHPEKEVRERLAGGLYNTTYMYTETASFSEMEECLNELRSLYREHPEKEVRRRLAMGVVNAIYMYANTADFSRMEECLNELRSLYREHPEKEVGVELAKGLYNTTVHDLILLYKLRSLLPEIPDWKKRRREIEAMTIAFIVEVLGKNEKPEIKETLHTMKSELSDAEFVLLMNEISDRIPWKVQKIVWEIIDSGKF